MQEKMQEKSLIKKKILKYLEDKGISKYEFYKQTGISRGILDQNNGMSEENTLKFLAEYGNEVSADFLFSTNENMAQSSPASLHEILQENSQPYHSKNKLTAVDLLIQEKDQRIEAMLETIGTLRKYIRRLEEDLERSKIQEEEKEKPAGESGQKRKAVG